MAGLSRSLPLLVALALGACTMDNPAFDDALVAGEGSESSGGDGDGDEPTTTSTSASTSGDGDGDPATSAGDGDGDGDDPTTVGDGDGDPDMCGELTECDGGCVDLETDDAHCGMCGNKCTEGTSCEDSDCVGEGRIIFVSSEPVTGFIGGIGGVGAGDILCNALALEAGLQGAGSYYAWLATPEHSPDLDFTKQDGFIRPDGKPIAGSWLELINGQQLNPIDQTEWEEPAEGPSSCNNGFDAVWTGVTSKGELQQPNCNNWTSNGGLGNVGLLGSLGNAWTESGCTLPCGQAAPIYCVQQ